MERLRARTWRTALSSFSASEKVAITKFLSTDGLLLLFFCFVAAERHLVSAVSGHAPDLPHGHHGQEADKQQEAGKEQSKCSHQNSNINQGGIEHAPA